MKKIIVGIGAVSLLIVFCIGIFQVVDNREVKTLTTEEVKSIVAKQYPGEVTKLERVGEETSFLYEVELTDEQQVYHLQLNGKTGEVMQLQRANEGEGIVEVQTEPTEQKVPNIPAQQRSEVIGICEASEIAMRQGGILEEIELEIDRDVPYYEAKLRSDQQKLKLSIDAVTGEVIRKKEERASHPSQIANASKGQAMLTYCDIAQIATATTPGIIAEIELETKYEQMMYKVKLYDGKNKTSVGIHPITGDVLFIEMKDHS